MLILLRKSKKSTFKNSETKRIRKTITKKFLK